MALPNPFGRFFNDPDLEQIEGFINGILSTPIDSRDDNTEAISSELINSLYNNDKEKPELEKIFSQFAVPAERLQRYAAYDEIYASVQMIKRIVKVYKPYIIQKNPVSGSWYLLRKTDYAKKTSNDEEQKARDAKDYFDDTIKSFNLLKKLKNNIIHNQLLYGDCFVEVLDLKKEKEKIKDLSKITILNEIELSSLKKEVNNINQNTPQLQLDSILEAVTNKLVNVDSAIDEDELVKDDLLKFGNTLLRVHKPHNIIMLETQYGSILGYLEITKNEQTQNAQSVGQALSNITNKLVNYSNKDGGNTITNSEVIVNKIIYHILKKVNESRGNKDSKTKFEPSVIDDLKRFVIEQGLHNKQLNLKPIEVRYIPVDKMVNFNLSSSENYPYGGSLIESLMLPGKLFILSQLSNLTQKLSRAPLTR